MLFLELTFEYDTDTKVMVRPNLGNTLAVVGMKSTDGRMVDEFYKLLRQDALPYARTLGEFSRYLGENYGIQPRRLSQHSRLSTWLEQISVALGPAHNTSGSLIGRDIRFYRDDAHGANTWVWKDNIRTVDVLVP